MGISMICAKFLRSQVFTPPNHGGEKLLAKEVGQRHVASYTLAHKEGKVAFCAGRDGNYSNLEFYGLFPRFSYTRKLKHNQHFHEARRVLKTYY